jgi:gamma-tubulin complex component 3
VSEKALLRDLLYVLQGIDGTHVKYDKSLDRFTVDPKGRYVVARHQLIAVCTISELGWLFKRINDELAQLSGKTATGMIGGGLYTGPGHTGLVEQSFREGIQSELRAYWRMIAILRGLIENPETVPVANNSGPMTLLRLVQYVSEPMRRLKWLAIAMSLPEKPRDPNPEAQIPISKKPPPPLPNRLQQLSLLVGHGDPFVRSLGRMLEEYALRPIVTMIEQWCFQGQLVDPYGEFFIEKNKEISSKRRIVRLLVPFLPNRLYLMRFL